MSKIKNKIKPIDEPVYGYWKALVLSFYSKRLYIDVGKRWSGHGIYYLLLMILVWSIPFSFKLGFDFNDIFNQQLIDPLSKIPTMFIQNGLLKFDKPMPYLVKNKKNEVVLIVDTTGKVTSFNDKYPKLSVLITQNKVSFRIPSIPLLSAHGDLVNTNKPIEQIFSPVDNALFDGKKIVQERSFTNLKYGFELLIYPLVVSIFFSLFVFIFLMLGFLGQLFSRILFSFKLTLKQSNRLLIVGTTPMMLVLLILLLGNLTFIGFGYLLVTLVAIYFSFAVYSLKSESKRLVFV
jgi:hypothetical protein